MTITTDELCKGLDTIEQVLEDTQSYVDRWPDLACGECVVETRCELGVDTDALLCALRAQPSLLDPFAQDPTALRSDSEPHFAGMLTVHTLIWSDTLQWSTDGLVAESSGQWPWELLRRQVRVRPSDRAGACEMTLRIEWNGGAGSYEPLVSGCVALFVRQRLSALIEAATAIVQSARTHLPTTTRVSY
jgi:hypothetical protein